MKLNTIIKPLVLACSIVLAACSSDDDPAPAGSIKISGLVEAPNGVVAQFEHDKPFLLAATDLLVPPAHADIIGLDPVGGATVELIRIDNDGNQIGDVLASTVTSITGNYDLALPAGVSLAGNLIVRITGNSGTSMSAMVVELAVDINPISQYVLDKFVDVPNLVLGDLALNEVVSLQDKVEAFDLTATADLSSMLAQLDAELGELVDTEIAVLTSPPDDGTAVAALAGSWNSVELGIGMQDTELSTSGTFELDTLSEGMSIAAGAVAGEVEFSTGVSTLIDAFTNYTVTSLASVFIGHDTSLTSDTEVLAGSIDSDGNIVLELPFEEDLDTVDLQQDPDGPDFGWRWPPVTIAVNNTGNDNTLVFNISDVGVRYETIDTNNDGVKDAINPDAKVGDLATMGLGLLLKQGSGMGDTSLAGDYGIVSTTVDLATAPTPLGSADTTVGVVNFNNGTANVGSNAFDNLGFTREATSLTSVTLSDFGGTEGPFTFPYSVTAEGMVTLDPDSNGPSPEDLEGWANDDGSVIGLVNVQAIGSPIITAVTHEIMVGVKLPATTPAMGNAVFKLYPVTYGSDENGLTEMVSLRSISSLTFDAGATTATADFNARGYQRTTDIAKVEALLDVNEVPFNYTVTIGANGAIAMNFSDPAADEISRLDGFISGDGKMLVLRNSESDDTVNEKFRAIGMAIGIRQ